MIELLKERIAKYSSSLTKLHDVREYLQLCILRAVDEQGYFRHLSFVGGTALRILYDLKRFSEDLDFCLVDAKGYDFAHLMESIKKHLSLEGLSVSVKYKDHNTVASGFIKFEGLLFELGLTAHKDQVLLIKFEVDQRPAMGYQTTLSMINQDFLVAIGHFDLPSLFAGKLHALLCRKYAKGRDYYDLIWYVGRKVIPNYGYLSAAIEQTEGEHLLLNRQHLIDHLSQRINAVDFARLRADIAPFLMDASEIRFFEPAVFLKLIQGIPQ